MKKLIFSIISIALLGCSAQDGSEISAPVSESISEENGLPPTSNGSTEQNNEEEGETSFPNGDSAILFVGNSLTYFNDLPKLVENEAVKKGYKVNTDMLAKPNYAILDHWAEGQVQELIINGTYDYLIIQQGPSSQPWGRQVLLEYGEKFSELCSSNGTELVYFMVWPSLSYYHTFPGVIDNYREASLNTNSILCPVGEVWKNHFDKSGDFSYYGTDGFHPSLKGSQVAAGVIASKLYNKKPKN
ncbi:MAG: SGNH/GDSL hydrolase family protein [Bacteroidota bacterium]